MKRNHYQDYFDFVILSYCLQFCKYLDFKTQQLWAGWSLYNPSQLSLQEIHFSKRSVKQQHYKNSFLSCCSQRTWQQFPVLLSPRKYFNHKSPFASQWITYLAKKSVYCVKVLSRIDHSTLACGMCNRFNFRLFSAEISYLQPAFSCKILTPDKNQQLYLTTYLFIISHLVWETTSIYGERDFQILNVILLLT